MAVAKLDVALWPQDQSKPRKPKGFPILGLIPQIRENPLKFFVDTTLEFGDAVELDLGFDSVLMLNRPDYIKHVAKDNYRNYHKSKFYGPLKPILGDGIFLAEGDAWIKQRQMAAKGFQGTELRRMVADMCKATAQMLSRWSRSATVGAPIDICTEMSRLALDIVLRCLFNVDLADQRQPIFEAITTLLSDAERRVWAPIPVPRWIPTPGNLGCATALKTLDTFVQEIIQERRDSGGRKDDLLQILIDNYADPRLHHVPRNLLRDQVLSIIVAGHETSANALAWAWYHLSKHPDVARAAKEEVDVLLEGRAPSFENVLQLPYVKMIFDETLRLYPPVWTMSRTAQEADQIGDISIRKGGNVMLCPYAVHRRPIFWPNPEGFDPDRFNPKYGAVRRYAYFPFGAGARSCLGERFGTIESIIVLTMVIQSFRLSLVPGQIVEPEPMITLRPRQSIWMSLETA